MKKLVFTPPSPDSPGFLRRAKKGLEFKKSYASKEAGAELIDNMVEFLLPYVQEPINRSEAREALFDATENQFLELIDLVMGNTKEDENPTSAQPMKEQSSTGQAE